jgi:hypothetical protein
MSQIKFNVRRIHSTTGNEAAFTILRLYLKKDVRVSTGKQPARVCINCDEKKPQAGRHPHGAKACACGRILARQRPLPLRSKVVTTKMQLDINVERLSLKRGFLTPKPQL